MTFTQRTTAYSARLAPQERRVVQYMRDNLEEIAFASAAAIGAKTKTSDATVIRTAKALGYSGLPELKRAVGASLAALVRPSTMLHQRLEHLDTRAEAAIDQVADEAMELLGETRRMLRSSAFPLAVDALAQARQTIVYGAGISSIAADYFALKLNRISRPARAITTTGFSLADSLLPLRAEDVLTVFAPAQLMREHEVTVDHADRVGARVILVTDTLAPAFGDRVFAALPAAVSPTGRVSTSLSSLLVADALLLALAAIDEPEAVAASELLNRLRAAATGTETMPPTATASARRRIRRPDADS